LDETSLTKLETWNLEIKLINSLFKKNGWLNNKPVQDTIESNTFFSSIFKDHFFSLKSHDGSIPRGALSMTNFVEKFSFDT